MRRVIYIAPGGSATHTYRLCRWIDVNVLDGGKVDDQTIVTDSQASGIMPAASNRNAQIMFSAEMNGGHHVGYIRAFGDQTRFAIDHRVVYFAFFLVLRICRLNQITAELAFEFGDIFLLHVSYLSGQKNPATLSSNECLRKALPAIPETNRF